MKLIKSKKGLVLLATLAVAVVAAIGAYAYFSKTGSGSNDAASVGSVTADSSTWRRRPDGWDLFPTLATARTRWSTRMA